MSPTKTFIFSKVILPTYPKKKPLRQTILNPPLRANPHPLRTSHSHKLQKELSVAFHPLLKLLHLHSGPGEFDISLLSPFKANSTLTQYNKSYVKRIRNDVSLKNVQFSRSDIPLDTVLTLHAVLLLNQPCYFEVRFKVFCDWACKIRLLRMKEQ